MYATAVGTSPNASSSPTDAGPGANASPDVVAASGSSSAPPSVKPAPVVVIESRPGTGRAPSSDIAVNPDAASRAHAAPASAAPVDGPPSAGMPTSSTRPASASPTASRPRRSALRGRTSSTSTGDEPIVTSVATLTEVNDTAVK